MSQLSSSCSRGGLLCLIQPSCYLALCVEQMAGRLLLEGRGLELAWQAGVAPRCVQGIQARLLVAAQGLLLALSGRLGAASRQVFQLQRCKAQGRNSSGGKNRVYRV